MNKTITIEIPSTTPLMNLVQALVPLGLALTAAGPGRYVAKQVPGHTLPPPRINCACGNFASVFRDGEKAVCAECWMNHASAQQ